MDYLDLDTILPSSSQWMSPAFDQQDATFLSASRQMLEPIMEETSDDEENQSWPQYENVWSSESETGSVIRIELHNDQDTISERDFVCPAKRPRRDDLIILEESSPPYRKISHHQQQQQQLQRSDFLTTFNLNETTNNTNHDSSNYRKRFDEFYSDSDSLSYNSLSRSSSLIQFESIEKQLLSNDLGNSSPSLLSIDNSIENNSGGGSNNSSKGSNICLKRFESSEGKLHQQTYYDLDKINLNTSSQCNSLTFTDDDTRHHTNNKSDSESSDNSISSNEERIHKPSSSSFIIGNQHQQYNQNSNNDHRSSSNYKGKSSAENLSEDSGYCEYISALRIKSKSIPNFIRHNENLLEGQSEHENHKSFEIIFASKQEQNYHYQQKHQQHLKYQFMNQSEKSSRCKHDHDDYNDYSDDAENLLCSRGNNDFNRDSFYEEKQHQQNYNKTPKTTTTNATIKENHNQLEILKTKIDAKRSSSSTTIGLIRENNERKLYDYESADDEFVYWYNGNGTVDENSVKNRRNNQHTESSLSSVSATVLGGFLSSTSASASTISSASSSSSSSPSFSYKKIKRTSPKSHHHLNHSSSLPDVRIQCDHANNSSNKKSYIHNFSDYSEQLNDFYSKESNKDDDHCFTITSSLPNDLNIILSDSIASDRYETYDLSEKQNDWNVTTATTTRSSSASIKSSKNRSPFSSAAFAFCANLSLSNNATGGQNYMNASYNNLTLLDYSGRSKSNRSSFTMSDCSGNSKRNSREFELGKGNFLLDEISSHFDRNLSILSDHFDDSKIINESNNTHNDNDDHHQEEIMTKPKPPVRKSHSYREQSMNTIDDNQKHLSSSSTKTIEKPPRKNLQQQQLQKSSLSSSIKTFDQDPTILKTNYSESLEKCNFDPKELSNTDLNLLLEQQQQQRLQHNRRRFHHSTPIKRGFVSSTPNLNTFRHQNDDDNDNNVNNDGNIIDDILHVCSAHTSMNQLPTEKKLGILVSVEGSRTSLGKGVSFCPVVSEIRWREQSSEEHIDPLDSLENIKQQQQQHEEMNASNTNTIANQIDEVDTSNITNLNSNDNNSNISQIIINANNIQNSPSIINTQQQEKQQQKLQYNDSELMVTSRPNNNIIPESISTTITTPTNANVIEVAEKINIVDENQQLKTKKISNVSIVQEKTTNKIDLINNKNFNIKSKCIDDGITIKKLNDKKMLNCASGNKKNDDGDKEIFKNMDKVITINQNNFNNNNNNSVGLNKSATMPSLTNTLVSGGVGGNNNGHRDIGVGINTNIKTNTGTDLLNSKFKPKPDEKLHKNGFLSRFTGGFRFSLRRKKKPSNTALSTGDLNTNNETTMLDNRQQSRLKVNKKTGGAIKSFNQEQNINTPSKKSPDFIYIPLRGPIPGREQQPQQYFEPSYNMNRDENNGHLLHRRGNSFTNGVNNDNNHVLFGKPPLPKQPPRVVGVCEKVRASPQQQKILANSSFNYRHAPNYPQQQYQLQQKRSSSQPKEIDERILDSERLYYTTDGSYQLNTENIIDMNGDSFNNSSTISTTLSSSVVPGLNKHIIVKTLPPLPPTKCPAIRPTGISITGSTIGPNGNAKIGLIETNLDTHETIISGKTRSLMELGPQVRLTLSKQSAGCDSSGTTIIDGTTSSRRPHKSMEFLLDKENQKDAMPPENELQKSHDSTVALSEHQLRVQASLQRLNIPDWFRQYSSTPKAQNDSTTSYKPGNFTRKRASESARWTGLNSKTTSLSSLGSQRSDRSPLLLSPSAHSHHGGQVGFSRWSTSHLNSTQTSPSVSTRGSFSRGTGVNSSFSTGSASVRNSFRQPYLGWRSQEKLTSPRTPHERLASSLLAQKPPKKPEPAVTPEIQTSIKEVTSAIVHYVNDQTNRTSRSRSASPSSSKFWLESSFVGIRPLESPKTPTIENSTFNPTITITNNTITNNNQTISSSSTNSRTSPQSDVFRMNGVATTPLTSLAIATSDRSPSSASLEDVLASLLGLPTDSHRSTGDSANEVVMFRFATAATTTTISSSSPNSLQVDNQNRFRRRSEGDAQKQHQKQQQQQQPYRSPFLLQQQHHHQLLQQQPQQQQYHQKLLEQQQNSNTNSTETLMPNQSSRRVSLDSSDSRTISEILIKCRNTKCDQAATSADAKKHFKSCHNCSFLYCSRECRRIHWERHRKFCLHSRVSNLCRQVLSSCKDDTDTLRHLSLLARKGFLTQGRGVIRMLFRSAENAEAFIKNGFQSLGEISYVRWSDLMPAEMGLELYSELLRLSTEYKPDSKMLVYVAICVVSEAPSSGSSAVKWERQLVSRCAKLKLCKTVLTEYADQLQQSANEAALELSQQESATEVLILTFNLQRKLTNLAQRRDIILINVETVLHRRGVVLRKHYPEIFQRLQNFVEGQTDRFVPVTLHPRDAQTGKCFVCIIMPTYGETELVGFPTSSDRNGGHTVTTINVGEELLES